MPRTLSAALVFGAEISNDKGEKVGQVEDLLVDVKSGHVIYVIVSFVDEVDVEGKYFPIPVKAIKENAEENEIQLEISREKLRNAPGFDKKNWPKGYDEDFIRLVYEHYGYKMPPRQIG